MKLAKVLLIVSFLICILLAPVPRAVSRNAMSGKRSGTSENPSTLNPTNPRKALEGMSILYGINENANTSIPPPPTLKLSEHGSALAIEDPQFIVTYDGFTDEARIAFQYAVDIWNSLIRPPVPIQIDASFTDLGGFDGEVIILGGARPAGWKSPGSLDLWFPEALADTRADRDLSVGEPDIITRFNSHEDANWYFGTDGRTPAGKTDFVSTVLHEIAHGLGFFSFASVEETSVAGFRWSGETGKLRDGTPDLPYIYDFFVENGAEKTIMSFPDPSSDLENQFTGNDLFWNGKSGVAANAGIRPQLHAPSSWEQGSSYTHLDEIAFPAGEADALMTPYLANQEAIHDPGPVALGMLEDIGWTINNAPVFIDGANTTRTLVNRSISNPVVAADADNDALTYHLSGTDAAAFDIDSATGQLKTETTRTYNKPSYTLTVTVSDGTLIDEIVVTIHVAGTPPETPTNSRPSFADGNHTSRTVAENTAKGVNIGNPIAATDADNDALTYTVSGPDAAAFDIDNTTGQLKTDAELDYEKKNTYTVTVAVSDGDLTATITVIIIIIDVDDQESPTLTLTSQPLTEMTLNRSIVTLTLSNRVYENWLSDPLIVSGIPGVTIRPFDVTRLNGTELSVQLTFYGIDLDTDATLTFTVKAEAIANYDGPDLTATAHVTTTAESVTASTITPLTGETLNGSVVTLTLNNGTYIRSNFDLDNAVTVSGIAGVTIGIFGVERVSDTIIIFELEFGGNFNTNATLTFTVAANAIAEYDGPALIAQLPVNGGKESVVASTKAPLTETTLNGSIVTLTLNGATYKRSTFDLRDAVSVSGIEGVTFHWFDLDRISDTELTVELTFKGNIDTDATLTFTVGAGAIADYNGAPLIVQVPVTGGKESVTVSSEAPLTEATLDESIITLTLSGRNYARSSYGIEQAVTIDGIEGVTIYDVDRISQTEITVELRFNGDFDIDTTLTFTVGANALLRYSGPALTAQLRVTGRHESIAASTEAPLTEATLDDSIITLTLTGRNYARSSFDIERAVTIAGIQGATLYDVDRISNTKITAELRFNGDIDTDAILSFTIGPNAIADYNGPEFTAHVSVSGGQESIFASTNAPLTEATLDDSVVTLTLTGRKYARSIFDIRGAVSVSGIDGVTIPWHEPDKKSDTQITVELEFDGNINVDSTLTFTIGADAIANYNGPALTAQITVTADKENALLANFPNPFNPETWIPYHLAKPAEVTITIYTVNGQVVRELALGHQPAGIYQNRSRAAYWDGRNAVGEPVASGVYFYTLSTESTRDSVTADDFTATRKMLIRK